MKYFNLSKTTFKPPALVESLTTDPTGVQWKTTADRVGTRYADGLNQINIGTFNVDEVVYLSYMTHRSEVDFVTACRLMQEVGVSVLELYDPPQYIRETLATFGYEEVSRKAGQYLGVSDRVTFSFSKKAELLEEFFSEYQNQVAFNPDICIQKAFNDYMYYQVKQKRITIDEHNKLMVQISVKEEHMRHVSRL